jgi:hypothetical protein
MIFNLAKSMLRCAISGMLKEYGISHLFAGSGRRTNPFRKDALADPLGPDN